MLGLLDSLTSENLVVICLVLGVIALCLAIGISIEMYTENKKYAELEKTKEDEIPLENTQSRLNIKESSNVKYVEEDRELEKTKAKMELEQLREKLRREEEEKQKIIEQNLQLEQEKENIKQEVEYLEDTLVDLKPIENEVKEQLVLEPQIEEAPSEQYTEIEKTKEISIPVVQSIDLSNDEDEAIISYEELKNAKSFGYTDEEMNNNVDEKDAIISMQELEKLYYESQSINVTTEEINPVAQNIVENNIEPSYNDTSLYGYSKTDQDLILEQTANLEKLNEEIRKTNEFLKMLKELKKNLD